MNFSKYFKPHCIKPVYLQDSIEGAGDCGFVNGIFYSIIFTVITLLFSGKYYLSTENIVHKKYILYGVGLFIGMLWIITPFIMSRSNKIMWKGYDEAKEKLKSEGYSNLDILNIIRLFEQGTGNITLPGIPGGMLFAKAPTGVEDKKDSTNK